MDVLIESTKDFEKDLAGLSDIEKAAAIQKINDRASLFSTQRTDAYHQLRRLPLPSPLNNGYESSLYTLRISQNLSIVLAVDEDPIFEQVIFTLFRAVKPDDLDRAYQDVAEFLYQGLHHKRETVPIS
ncbi:hypothetical protein [Phormidesmis priestleyi]